MNFTSRLDELEIQIAFQEDLIQKLNDCIVRLQQTLDLQQTQLRLIYHRINDQDNNNMDLNNIRDNIPPHY